MKLVAHLVRADIRRFRAVLLAWAIVVIGGTLVDGGRHYAASDIGLREAMAVAGSLFWVAEMLLLLLVISLVIHAHPTVGTHAFWLTRPIPPDHLLAAKLLLLAGVLVVFPAAADVALLAVYQVPFVIALGVVAQGVAIQSIVVLLLMIGAALTLNLARLAILCGAVMLSIAVSIGIAVAVTMSRQQYHGFRPQSRRMRGRLVLSCSTRSLS